MAKQIRKIVGKCQLITTEINGRITMRCKNLDRKPTTKEVNASAQSILDSIINHKVIYR